jgi:hypothetical protein
VDELIAFCERAYSEKGFTGFLVDPTDEDLGTPRLARFLDLDQIKELIESKAG